MYKVKFHVWRLIILDLQYYTFFTGFGVQSIKYIHEEQYNLTMELKMMLSRNKTHGAGAQTHNGLYCYCTLLQSRNILYCHVFIKQEVLSKNKLFTTAINILEASPKYIPCATRGFNPKFLHYNFRCGRDISNLSFIHLSRHVYDAVQCQVYISHTKLLHHIHE